MNQIAVLSDDDLTTEIKEEAAASVGHLLPVPSGIETGSDEDADPLAVATRSLVRRQSRLADVKGTWVLRPPCADAIGLSSSPPKAPGRSGTGCSPIHTGPAG